jgi:hypothetical protein
VIKRDEIDELRSAPNIDEGILQIIACIFEVFPTPCPEREAVLGAIITAHTQIREQRHRQRLN